MTKPNILVTGATGKTGSAAAYELLGQGYPVRALVRRVDSRSEALREAGAEICVGNMLDIHDMRRALNGMQRAYFVGPMERNLLYTGTVFAAAAVETGLETAVVMSQWLADPHHPSFATRETWLTDVVMRWLPGVDVITVNPGWFADNYMLVLDMIAQLGIMPMPLGQGLTAPPSNEDMGRVIAAALIDPAPYTGKTFRPTGPELLSPQEIAAIFSKVLQRKVRYWDITEKTMVKALVSQGRPAIQISQLRYYTQEYRRNAFAGKPTSVVKDMTGHEPENFETIVRRYVANNPAVKRTPANQVKAVGALLKLLMTPARDMDRFEQAQQHALLREPKWVSESQEWLAAHT